MTVDNSQSLTVMSQTTSRWKPLRQEKDKPIKYSVNTQLPCPSRAKTDLKEKEKNVDKAEEAKDLVCSSSLSVTVIKHPTRSSLARREFIRLILLGHSPSLGEVEAGFQSKNLEAGTREEHCLVAHSGSPIADFLI